MNRPSRKPGNARPPLSPAIASRQAAVAVLGLALDRRRPLDEAVDAALNGSGLEPRDRAFARLAATTVIRRLEQIDDALGRLTDARLPLHPEALMNLLRLGAAQLLFLKTPPHAAVATAVDLADSLGLSRGKGLANAVLRRLAREGDAILADQDELRLNTPDWFRQRWSRAYGEATARAIAAQHLAEPPLDLTLTPGEDVETWAEALEASVLPTGALRRTGGGRIEELPGFAEGKWWVQDAAAALPVRLFGNVRDRTIFDLCAAPGGKTMQLAAAGAQVTAIDRSAARIAIVESNLKRVGLTAKIATADALIWKPGDGNLADGVLLDAPCTATGTIRRHPDLPLTKGQKDLAQLTALQTELLVRAADLVKPGGTLIYCTCSLEPEEGEAQIARFLSGREAWGRNPIRADELSVPAEAITQAGDLRTLPCHWAEQGGMDGFFAARLIRKE